MAPAYPNMTRRQILQRLQSGEWLTITQLGVMAGEGLLERLNKHGGSNGDPWADIPK